MSFSGEQHIRTTIYFLLYRLIDDWNENWNIKTTKRCQCNRWKIKDENKFALVN